MSLCIRPFTSSIFPSGSQKSRPEWSSSSASLTESRDSSFFISLRHTRISSTARAINRNSAAQKMTAAALYGRRSIYGRETDETTAQSRTS